MKNWRSLETPVRILVDLLIVLSIAAIYRQAEFLVVHIAGVLLLFLFATIIALLLTPIVDRMQRIPPFKGRRAFAVLTLYAAMVSAIAAAVSVVIPAIAQQGTQLPALAARVQVELDRLGIPVTLSSLQGSGGIAGGAALGILASVFTAISNGVLTIVISIYLLIEGRALIATARNVFPSKTRTFDFVILAFGSTMVSYVRGQLIMSTVIGAYTAITLSVIGVHYALVLGAAAFFLEMIPIVGAVIAMGLAVGVALLQSPLLALVAAVTGLLGHALDAYILGPRVNGRVVQLHALVAMAALLIGAELGGILGALFAVPTAAMANILLGAFYRSRRGDEAMSTGHDGGINVATLPRLGAEIGGVEDEGVVDDPTPRPKSSAGNH